MPQEQAVKRVVDAVGNGQLERDGFFRNRLTITEQTPEEVAKALREIGRLISEEPETREVASWIFS